jgi:hypothetical protein
VVTPPRRTVKKNAPDWYEEMHERQRSAHSSRRIRVGHGIAHLKNWLVLARHQGRREHMTDVIQSVAGLLSHQQAATLASDCHVRTPGEAELRVHHRQPHTSSQGGRSRLNTPAARLREGSRAARDSPMW